MFTTLPTEVQEDLHSLARNFGQPLIDYVELTDVNLFDPLNATDRYGEVCMVIRRPNGHLLTGKKTFYPAEAHRLLTGGIHAGEKILDALLRETQEETGLEVVVRRFLVAAAYYPPHQPDLPVFYTFAFLLEETHGTLTCQDPDEQLEYFREITPEELLERAEFLSHLPSTYSKQLHGSLANWGTFRAIIHRLVWRALTS